MSTPTNCISFIQHAPLLPKLPTQNNCESQSDSVHDIERTFASIPITDLPDTTIKNSCSQLAPEQLRIVLERIFTNNKLNDPFRATPLLSTLIPLENLQHAASIAFPEHQDAITTAKALFQEALYYLEQSEQKESKNKNSWLQQLVHKLISAIKTILSVLGIENFFTLHSSDSDMATTFQHLNDLSLIFYNITATLIPILGMALGGTLIAAAFALILVMSLAYPYFKKHPLFIPFSENWSEKIQTNTFFDQYAKKSCLDEIARALSPLSQAHPLLIGRSEEEKRNIAQAFSQAVVRGTYKSLQNKNIVYIDTKALVAHNDPASKENDCIRRIEQVIDPYRNNTILIVDDFHLLSQTENQQLFGQLTHLLRLEHGCHPYIIGLTTKNHFEQKKATQPFEIQELTTPIFASDTDENETSFFIHDFLFHHAQPYIEEADFWQFYFSNRKKNTLEPYDSLRLAHQYIQEQQNPPLSPLTIQIQKTRSELAGLFAKKALEQGTAILPYNPLHSAIEATQKKLDLLEGALKEEKAKQMAFVQAKEQLVRAKKMLYRSAIKVVNLQHKYGAPSYQNTLAEFELICHFLLPALEKKAHLV